MDNPVAIIILIMGGCFFALPALFPPLRRRARESIIVRWALISITGFVLFISIYLFLTFLNAAANGANYPGHYFPDDAQNDQLLRELWLHYSIPPFLLSETSCFNSDPAICNAAEDLGMSENSINRYITIFLFYALTPAISCALTLWYITRDDRKQKSSF